MSDAFRPLPTLSPRLTTEPARAYGVRALMFLLLTGCTASLDDDTLEQALAASTVSVSGELCDVARLRLHALRIQISRAIAFRGQLAKAAPTPAAAPSPRPRPRPGGRPAPLVPPTPMLPPSTTARRL